MKKHNDESSEEQAHCSGIQKEMNGPRAIACKQFLQAPCKPGYITNINIDTKIIKIINKQK